MNNPSNTPLRKIKPKDIEILNPGQQSTPKSASQEYRQKFVRVVSTGNPLVLLPVLLLLPLVIIIFLAALFFAVLNSIVRRIFR